MQQVLKGMDLLGDLYETTPKEQEYVSHKGLRIKRLMLKSCRKYYEMAWHIFLGDWLLRRLSAGALPANLDEVRKRLKPGKQLNETGWIDISGMNVPVEVVEELFEEIAQRKIPTLEVLNLKLTEIHQNYEGYITAWLHHVFSERHGRNLLELDKETLLGMLGEWKVNAVRLNNMILSDAKKEFDAGSRIGFGIDGDEEIRQADFKAVRGEYEENGFVNGIRKDIGEIEKKAAEWIEILSGMPD
jgi:hypothetical protein